jgi:large subunit ribosomal protein L25
MELTVYPRNEHKKGLTKQVRRDGNIPAIVYSTRLTSHSITVDGPAFHAQLRVMKKGHLPNTVFVLKDENNKRIRAVVKEIQYHKVTYDILHLDFQELVENSPIMLNIPVEMMGQAECIGVKAGGALRLIRRHVTVKCLPENIPTELVIHVQDMDMKDSRRVRDITAPAGVELMAKPQEVVATIAKR